MGQVEGVLRRRNGSMGRPGRQ